MGRPNPPQQAPRPGAPIGFLVEEPNGPTHPVVGDTVIGSDPRSDPEAVIGAASIITIEDPSVFEVHVRIKVQGRRATVTEAGFGSAWIQAGTGPMTPLTTAGHPLEPGTTLRLGSRTLMYRSTAT